MDSFKRIYTMHIFKKIILILLSCFTSSYSISMELNSTVAGSWSSSSPDSVHLPGNPLETYTFTLSTSALIFTCLDTNVGDAFLSIA